MDSLRGAYIGAGTALCALLRVDRILFTFRDSANGAFIDASAASDAIVTNYVSHFVCFLVVNNRFLFSKSNSFPPILVLFPTEKYLIYRDSKLLSQELSDVILAQGAFLRLKPCPAWSMIGESTKDIYFVQRYPTVVCSVFPLFLVRPCRIIACRLYNKGIISIL